MRYKRFSAFLNFREYLKLKAVDFLLLALLHEPRFNRVLIYACTSALSRMLFSDWLRYSLSLLFVGINTLVFLKKCKKKKKKKKRMLFSDWLRYLLSFR